MPALLARLAFVLLAIPAMACPPERGPMPHLVDLYGDPLPEGAVARLGSVRLRHQGLKDFTILEDGKVAVTVGDDQMVRWWDMTSGSQTRAQRLPSDLYFNKFAISRDGSRVVVLSGDELVLCDTSSGKNLRTIKGTETGYDCLKFSPDGTILAAGSAGMFSLFDLVTGEKRDIKLAEPPERGHRDFLRLSFSADGKRLVAGGLPWKEQRLVVFDLTDVKEIFSKPGRSLAEALSPDGIYVAMCSHQGKEKDKDITLRMINLKSGRENTVKTGIVGEHCHLGFADDGKSLACMGPNKTLLLDPMDGKLIREFPDGTYHPIILLKTKLVTRDWNRLEAWDTSSGRPFHNDPGTTNVGSRASTSDGRHLAVEVVGRDSVGIWNTDNGRFLRYVPMPGYLPYGFNLAFTQGERALTSCMSLGMIRTWSARERIKSRALYVEGRDERWGPYHEYRLSSDGMRIAAIVRLSDEDEGPSRLDVWDATTGRVIHRHKLPPLKWPGTTNWLADSTSVIINMNGGIAFVCPDTGTVGTRIPSKDAFGIVTSDCRLLATRDEKTIRAWDILSGRELTTITAANSVYQAVGISANTRSVMLADGRYLQVVDLATGKEIGRRALPDFGFGFYADKPVREIQALPGDRQLLTTLEDGTALIWDLTAFPPAKLADKHDDALRTTWWNDLAGDDAKVAYASGWKLSEGPPEDVVRFLRERLKPARDPDWNWVKQLIADLNNGEFRTREAASKRLIELGPGVLPYLRAAQKKPESAEAGRRIEALIEKLSDPVPPPASLQAIRAIAVLERIGTNDARKLLEELARGAAGSPETKSVNSALVRMRALAGGW